MLAAPAFLISCIRHEGEYNESGCISGRQIRASDFSPNTAPCVVKTYTLLLLKTVNK